MFAMVLLFLEKLISGRRGVLYFGGCVTFFQFYKSKVESYSKKLLVGHSKIKWHENSVLKTKKQQNYNVIRQIDTFFGHTCSQKDRVDLFAGEF